MWERLLYRAMRVRNDLSTLASEARHTPLEAAELLLHRYELLALELLSSTMEARGLLLERRPKT
jgi:hypothetical protein